VVDVVDEMAGEGIQSCYWRIMEMAEAVSDLVQVIEGLMVGQVVGQVQCVTLDQLADTV
jgi:hypothetical protein